MHVLTIKLGATGDVVRTTPLLRRFNRVTWVTASKNRVLLDGLQLDSSATLRVISWEDRASLKDEFFDLVINLEDDVETAGILGLVRYDRLFGAYANDASQMAYTKDAASWFDLSLISAYGRERADGLKYLNRRTYQDMIFEGLGLKFAGEEYFLPPTSRSDLQGDVAIAPEAGPVWPMKKW